MNLLWLTEFVFQFLSSTTVIAILSFSLVWQQTERVRNMFSTPQAQNTAMTSIQGFETHCKTDRSSRASELTHMCVKVSLQPTVLEIWMSLDQVPYRPGEITEPQKYHRSSAKLTCNVTILATSLKIPNSNVVRYQKSNICMYIPRRL